MILITAIENGFTIKIDNKLAQSRPAIYEITKSGGDTAISMAIKNVYTGEILVEGFTIDQIKIEGASFNNFEELSTAAVGVLFKKGGGSGGGGTGGIQSIQPGDNIEVDNVDPKNPIVSAIWGDDANYLIVTKTELDTHITNSTLTPGTLYAITETERWMLLGDSTDTLYLRAISANQLERKGMGKFFVPKYDQTIEGYGIWQGEVYEAFPTTVPEPIYAVDDNVIWGGRLWKNLTGLLGTKQDIYNLSSDWEIIPFDEVNYNIRFDKIEYDYQNDMIIYRKDDNGNEISTTYQDWLIKENDYFDGNLLNISLWNSLKIYQWGNEFNYNSSKGCGFNIVTNSILECLNTCGHIYSNILENNGQINSNTLDNNGQIHYNTLNNGRIYSNTLNNGQIHYNTLNNGQIHSNTLENNGNIYSNTLENFGQIRLGLLNPIDNKLIQDLTITNGDIGGDSGTDLSSATLVYAKYTREVFKNSAGITKIKYFNENDVLIIADITD